jgi:hypothetical protein
MEIEDWKLESADRVTKKQASSARFPQFFNFQSAIFNLQERPGKARAFPGM